MNQEKQKQENPKEQNKKQTLNGTGESSTWEKAAELIAGDNKLMASLLKLLLSPLVLLAGAGLIVYLFIKNKSLKDEVNKLKEENKKISDENLFIASKAEKFRKKFNKLKQVLEIEQAQADQRSLPHGTTAIHNVNKNKTTYLR